jgi:hypothetical protein
MLGGALESCGIPPAGCDQLGDSTSAHRDKRKFGGDKEAICSDENKDRQNSNCVGQTTIARRHDLLSTLRRIDHPMV